MSEQAATENQQQQEPQIIRREVAGAVFEGTVDEVLDKMAKSVEHGTATIRAQKESQQELSRLVEELKKPPVQAGTFDKQKYYAMLTDDPLAAADYVDQTRYGVPREQLQAQWTKSLGAAEKVEQMGEVNRFQQAATDWPGTPEASETLLRYLIENKREVTAGNMALAYGELRASGAIKPAVKVETEETERTTRRPPPSARGQQGANTGGKAPENQTLAELRATIEKGGMGRQ